MPEDRLIVQVLSDAHGVGKSTVAAIIYEALTRCGYAVKVLPLTSDELPRKEAMAWITQEREVVTTQGATLLADPKQSHPRATVSLWVHG
ncbi:MAG: hypothetical protein A2Y38_02700 [Spirochaetes bacterium GWB1_59_5]|nr:MAG: hypothetical protein A2Y38_02700 [Spirochaetes bacterium GWB1_59_5]